MRQGARCGSCSRYLEDGYLDPDTGEAVAPEPAAYWHYSKYGAWGAVQLLCLRCWEKNPYVNRDYGDQFQWQCRECERPLLWQWQDWLETGRYRYCSVYCAQAHRRSEAKAEKVRLKVCQAPGCEEPLTGKRADAKTCSPSCRTKLMKERKRSASQ